MVFTGTSNTLTTRAQTMTATREAGILAGDLITTLNGESVNDVNVMKDTFYDIGVGGEAVFTILRGGEERTISLILSD